MTTPHALILLDRDGVLNRERGMHTWELSDFEILPGVVPALREAAAAGYRFAVITNQSGIGLGLYGHEEVRTLHVALRRSMEDHGVRLEEVLYCPHHPSRGRCLCRKPGGLLVERALARMGMSAANSWFIGDRERDMEAARSVGVRGLLVEANSDLRQAVSYILAHDEELDQS
ncbi:MAG: HAD family hydrolase [Flavobacteriales bacterium]